MEVKEYKKEIKIKKKQGRNMKKMEIENIQKKKKKTTKVNEGIS